VLNCALYPRSANSGLVYQPGREPRRAGGVSFLVIIVGSTVTVAPNCGDPRPAIAASSQ
jgi:hypothetical protein